MKGWPFRWQLRVFFFSKKKKEMQEWKKEWRIKADLFLFKSPTRVKWRDTIFMKSNIYLPSTGNKATPKQLETPADAMCPDFKRHKAWLHERWSLIRCYYQRPWLLTPLTVRGLMYITLAKARKSASMAGSIMYTWSSCEQWKRNVG